MRGRVGVIQVWGISVSGVEQKWLRWPAFRHSRQRIAVQGRHNLGAKISSYVKILGK